MVRKFKFGYKYENMKIVIVEEEAKLVREMHQDYLSGLSTSQIAKKLNTQPIRYNEKKSSWERGHVSYIFKDSAYLGNEDYPKIVEKEIKDAVLELTENKVHRIPEEEQAHAEVFKDKMRCSVCGKVIARRSIQKGRLDLVHMRCVNKECECSKTSIHLVKLEEYIKNLFDTIANNLDLIEEMDHEENGGSSMKTDEETKLLKISMRNPSVTRDDVINKIMELASMRFSDCRTSNYENVTKKLREEIQKGSQDHRISAEAIDKTIQRIILTPERIVKIRFKNGREFEERLE